MSEEAKPTKPTSLVQRITVRARELMQRVAKAVAATPRIVIGYTAKGIELIVEAPIMALIFPPLFLGLLFLVAALALGVFSLDVRIPLDQPGETGFFTRQVGYIQALHWWFATFVLFPIFLIILKSSAKACQEFIYAHARSGKLLDENGAVAGESTAAALWAHILHITAAFTLLMVATSIAIGMFQWWSNSGCWLMTDGARCTDIVSGIQPPSANGLPFWREWGLAGAFNPSVSKLGNAMFTLANYLYFSLLWGFVYLHFILFAVFVSEFSAGAERARRLFLQDRAPSRFKGPIFLPLLSDEPDPLGLTAMKDIISKSKLVIVLFVAVGIYFVLYNSFLQKRCGPDAPDNPLGRGDCANIATYLQDKFNVVVEDIQNSNSIQVILQFLFEPQNATVYNYFAIGTVVSAAIFLAVASWVIRQSFDTTLTVARNFRSDAALYDKYYANTSREVVAERLGAAQHLVNSISIANIVAFTIATTAATILTYLGLFYVLRYLAPLGAPSRESG